MDANDAHEDERRARLARMREALRSAYAEGEPDSLSFSIVHLMMALSSQPWPPKETSVEASPSEPPLRPKGRRRV